MKSLLIASALLMAGTAYAAPYQKAPASDRAPYAAKSVFKAAPNVSNRWARAHTATIS